jgi:uncharacterized membrane protein HdeD (DUF308 family)
LLAIVFGVVVFAFPGIALLTFVLIFGGYAVADGILILIAALRFSHPDSGRWWWLIVEGILGIAIGVVTFLWPHITAIALGILVAAWAISTGVFEIGAAIRMRKDIPNEIFLIVVGLLSIAVGVYVAIFPLAGLLAWVWVIGVYAVIAGIALIALSFRLRGMKTALPAA